MSWHMAGRRACCGQGGIMSGGGNKRCRDGAIRKPQWSQSSWIDPDGWSSHFSRDWAASYWDDDWAASSWDDDWWSGTRWRWSQEAYAGQYEPVPWPTFRAPPPPFSAPPPPVEEEETTVFEEEAPVVEEEAPVVGEASALHQMG